MKASLNNSCTNYIESFDGHRISKSTFRWVVFLTFILFGVVAMLGVVSAGEIYDCSTDSSILGCYHFNNDYYYLQNNSYIDENGTVVNYTESIKYTEYFNETFRQIDSSSKSNNLSGYLLTYKEYEGYLADGAFYFNNTGYLNRQTLGKTNNITLCAWVKPEVSSTNKEIIASWASDGGYKITFYSDDIYFWVRNSTSNTYDQLSTTSVQSSTTQNNTWIHVCGRRNSDANFSIYVNGKHVVSKTNITGVIGSSAVSGNLTIGANSDFGSKFTGQIDEVLIFNRSLSDNQIQSLFSGYLEYCQSNSEGYCYINSSLTLDGHNYTIGQHITTYGNNLILDCNNSFIYGNYPNDNSTSFLIANGFKNITLKNCNLVNFYKGIIQINSNITYQNLKIISNYYGIYNSNNNIEIDRINITNSILENNIYGVFTNHLGYGDIFIKDVVGYINKSRCYDCSYGSGILYLQGSFKTKVTIINFTGNQSIVVPASIRLEKVNNSYIGFSKHYGSNHLYAYGFYIVNSTNNIFENNYLDKTQYGLGVTYGDNNTIRNNIIYNNDEGSQYLITNRLYFYNNTIVNSTNRYMDGYGVGIKLYGVTNSEIYNNNFTDPFTNVFLLQGTRNIQIRNNYGKMLNVGEKSTYGVDDKHEPSCVLQSTMRYKGWWLLRPTDYYNENLTYINNSFINSPCLAHLENQYNFTHDLTDYWYRSFNTSSTNYSGFYEFYIPNNQENLSGWYNNQINYNFRISNGSSTFAGMRAFEWSLSKNIFTVKNLKLLTLSTYNDTLRNESIIYKTTNALITFSNNSLYSTGLFTGDANLTLPPGNSSYIYNNYILTEGRPLTGEPFNFTQTTTSTYSKAYSISSVISNNLTVPVNLTVPSGYIVTSITITPKDQPSYKVAGTQTDQSLYIPSVNLSYSTSSNVITLGLTTQSQSEICTGFFDAGMSFGTFIALIIIVSIAGVILVFLMSGDNNLDTATIISGSILIGGIVLSIGMSIISNINQC